MNLKRHCLPFAALILTANLSAQAPPTVTTGVMVALTLKPGIERSDIAKVMPQEVRDTVKLYLDGKIQQWFSRSDGKGVVFILNCATVADAQTIMDSLPLSRGHFVNLEFTGLGPLTPLRLLVAEPKP